MKAVRHLTLVVLALGLFAALPATAATMETKVRALLRDKPVSTSRIVQRLPAGKRLTVLGRDAEGNWAHVRVGGQEGWLQLATLTGARGEDQDASEAVADPARPLAKRRGVRPEAWVAKSRYHEGEGATLIVSVNKAELYGRPSRRGAMLGILRRGEAVEEVTRSPDKQWINIDIGGGESAWIEARAVKPGKLQPLTPLGSEADTEAPSAAPTTTPEETRRVRRVSRPRGAATRSHLADEELTAADEERPPPRRRQRGTPRDTWKRKGRFYFTPAAHAGIAILVQRFTSNGTGPLANYQASTNALGAQVGLGAWATAGRYFLFGVDAGYVFAGAAALRYVDPTDGTALKLGVQTHTLDAGLSAGVHFGALGGLSLRLRVGGEMILNLVQAEPRTKLPSDRVVGMTVGLAVEAPALFAVAGHPFGAWLFGGGLVPAARAQTSGLEDGAHSSTFGAYFGGGLALLLLRPDRRHYKGQLALEATYGYSFAVTHYTGVARRDPTVTIADRGSAQHLIALGLAYSF